MAFFWISVVRIFVTTIWKLETYFLRVTHNFYKKNMVSLLFLDWFLSQLPGVLQGQLPLEPGIDRPPTCPGRGLTAPHTSPLYTLSFAVQLYTLLTAALLLNTWTSAVLLSGQRVGLIFQHCETAHTGQNYIYSLSFCLNLESFSGTFSGHWSHRWREGSLAV